MRLLKTISVAVHALRRNVARAVLTMLGIVIGVGAVIAMMEIGSGSSNAIARTIASMGANNLIVMPGTAASGGVSFGAGSVKTLTPRDCDAILRECPAVGNAAPIVRARTQVVYGSRNWVPFFIYGSSPNYLAVRDWTDLAEGQAFTEQDVRNANKVCLLGQTIVRELFGGRSPLDQNIRIKNVTFRVVGVLRAKGANMMGMDQDDIVLTPWTTLKYRVTGSNLTNENQSADTSSQTTSTDSVYPPAQSVYPTPTATELADTPLLVRFADIDQILAVARTSAQIPAAIREITALLRERHRIRPGEPDDFSIRDLAELMGALSKTTTLMTTLLLFIALISLVVGGVGIMNIMLVSVTERTREIGLRMAVGARPRDILTQFLVEAVLLCLAGGALGILLGRVASSVVAAVLGWPVESSPQAIATAFAVSAGVGIFFGLYPAFKAAHMDPIEALRYE